MQLKDEREADDELEMCGRNPITVDAAVRVQPMVLMEENKNGGMSKKTAIVNRRS